MDQNKVHEKGFNMISPPTSTIDKYSRLKLGPKQYEDAVLDLHYYDKKISPRSTQQNHFSPLYRTKYRY